jgi:hypothetical protein
LRRGDRVKILKEGGQRGNIAIVVDPSWKGLVKVQMEETGELKSYIADELRLETRLGHTQLFKHDVAVGTGADLLPPNSGLPFQSPRTHSPGPVHAAVRQVSGAGPSGYWKPRIAPPPRRLPVGSLPEAAPRMGASGALPYSFPGIRVADLISSNDMSGNGISAAGRLPQPGIGMEPPFDTTAGNLRGGYRSGNSGGGGINFGGSCGRAGQLASPSGYLGGGFIGGGGFGGGFSRGMSPRPFNHTGYGAGPVSDWRVAY